MRNKKTRRKAIKQEENQVDKRGTASIRKEKQQVDETINSKQTRGETTSRRDEKQQVGERRISKQTR